MASKPSPVTPEVVRWALNEDGRELHELAEAVRVDIDILDAWGTGDASPTTGDVSRLAAVLHRPRALFFLPRAPTPATLPTSFRHPPGDDRSISALARRRVREARRIQHAVAWARRDQPGIVVPRAAIDEGPGVAAAAARTWLNVSAVDQAGWADDYAALQAWRDALDARGVLVFVVEVGRDDVRGFSSWDERAPLIVANLSGVTPAARCFTIAHELGHLISRQDAACVEPGGDGLLVGANVERWCEQFAAELLMPTADFRSYVRDRNITAKATIADVRAVMRRFHVSARAAALRLIDLEYAKATLYGEVLQVFVPKPPEDDDRKPQNAPRHVARVRQYGTGVIATVLEALPPRDALSVLRMTVDDARRIAADVPGVHAP